MKAPSCSCASAAVSTNLLLLNVYVVEAAEAAAVLVGPRKQATWSVLLGVVVAIQLKTSKKYT